MLWGGVWVGEGVFGVAGPGQRLQRAWAAAVCGRSLCSVAARDGVVGLAAGGEPISIQDRKTNSNLRMLAVNSLAARR